MIVERINRQAELKSTDLGSLSKIIKLIVNPVKATIGDALCRLIISPNNGIANKASPKPTADRTKVQTNKINDVKSVRVVDDMELNRKP